MQSTRAGADTGFALTGVIVLALVLKYPFFEYGPRYAAATGESLVEGYARIGRWALWLYLAITLSTAFIVQGAVVLFTAFLVQAAFALPLGLPVVSAIVMAVCAGLLRLGRYRGLDVTTKVILTLLTISTLWAAGLVASRADWSTLAPWPPASSAVSLGFVLALVGWMPSAIDISVWSSVWTLAKNRDAGRAVSVKHAVLDFRVGYIATGVLAFAFLLLGAGVMYGSGTSFSNAGTQFSVQLVDLYGAALGSWTQPIVLVAVLTTMGSTALTVIDGFPRAIARTVVVLRGESPASSDSDVGTAYWLSGAMLAALTLLVVTYAGTRLTVMVDFATTVSFLTGPILGYLNFRVIRGANVSPADRPGRVLVAISRAGLVLLGGTAFVYLISWL
ncbi:MAG: NRAMP family divalent metal transporter [Vicinamibacterales bacterium]